MSQRLLEADRQISLLVLVFLFAVVVGGPSPALAASDLKLAPGLSFTDDSSSNFPIMGTELKDGEIARDRPTLIFFGTAHCWNTNREAERVVELYPRYRGLVSFVVVDLNDVSPEQRPLVAAYYRGYIPTLALFNFRGKLVYDKAGETAGSRADSSALETLLRSALPPQQK